MLCSRGWAFEDFFAALLVEPKYIADEKLNVFQFFSQIFCDELTVKAPVLNKNFVGALPCYDYSGKIDSRDITFQCGSIAHRAAGVCVVQSHSEALDEAEVRVIAG